MVDLQDSVKTDKLIHAYFFAKNYVVKKGYGNEIDWQSKVSFQKLDAEQLLREAAWVILSAGLSARVVSTKFAALSNAFFDWDFNKIIKKKRRCRNAALSFFNHPKKIDSIIFFAEKIDERGIESIKKHIQIDGIKYLDDFPFMGPATKWHLAKNIGLDYAKPDRHLVRIATNVGYSTPQEMCAVIAQRINEKISVIDLVVWRFATIKRDYLSKLTHYLNHSS